MSGPRRLCFLFLLGAFVTTGSPTAGAGEIVAVSRTHPSMASPQTFGASAVGGVSQDGRYVVFASGAPNLVAGQNDANSGSDVFLHDRTTDVTSLVSRVHGSPQVTGNEISQSPSISADGRWIAFLSRATNLIAGGTRRDDYFQVYLYDRIDGTLTLVSRSAITPAQGGNGPSIVPAVSPDGRHVVYLSLSTDLVAGQVDTNGNSEFAGQNGYDVFLYDRVAGTTALASHAAGAPATAGDNGCGYYPPSVSDGGYVVLVCAASNLVAGQTDSALTPDVFLYDPTAGENVLVTHHAASATTAVHGLISFFPAGAPSMSADGRWIAFSSWSAELVTGQTDDAGSYDVFLYDRTTGNSVLVSRQHDAPLAAAGGEDPVLSADGHFVLFRSESTDLAAGLTDGNGTAGDVFLYHRDSAGIELVSRAAGAATTTGNGVSGGIGGRYSLSSDGAFVAFDSNATNLVAGVTDTNQGQGPTPTDTFLFERATGTMRLVSRTAGSATTTANQRSTTAAIAGDGSCVVFNSLATDLAASPADLNDESDVFVYGRATGSNTALSLGAPVTSTTSGISRPWEDSGAAISADGRWVAFTSTGSNLVAGQVDQSTDFSEGKPDVFLFDRSTGAVTLVSHIPDSPVTTYPTPSSSPVLSADGRYVAFLNASFFLGSYLRLHDRVTGSSTLVNPVGDSPEITPGYAQSPALSSDGRFLAFADPHFLPPLHTEDNGMFDVFLYDRVTAQWTLVSRSAASATVTANNTSGSPGISADGRHVVFLSRATNLVAGQTDVNDADDAFLFDRLAGTVALVSRSAGAAVHTGNAGVTAAVLADGGRYVAFVSNATDLVAGQTDSNGAADVFLHDLATGTTTLVSQAAGAATTAGNGPSSGPTISADGRFVAFVSDATNLVAGASDANGGTDVFLYDRQTGTTTLVSHAGGGAAAGERPSTAAWLSAGGSHVAFRSDARDLVAGLTDSNESPDLFRWERATGDTVLLSHVPAAPATAGNNLSDRGWISADGRSVAFLSLASDLVTGDFNGLKDFFLFSSGPAPASFYTLPPCRLVDTRQPGQGPALASGVSETWTLPGACGIPATARALSVNVTVTQPTGVGHLSFAPGDFGNPQSSTINFGPGQTRANNAILPLALNGLGTLRVSATVAGGGTVHVLVDVNGYFE